MEGTASAVTAPEIGLRFLSVADLRGAIAFLQSPEFIVSYYNKQVFLRSGPLHGLSARNAIAVDSRTCVEIRDVDRVSEVANMVARIIERGVRARVSVCFVAGTCTVRRALDCIVFQLSGQGTIVARHGRAANRRANEPKTGVLEAGGTAYVPASARASVVTSSHSCQLVATMECGTDVDFRAWLSGTLRPPGQPAQRVPVGSRPQARVDFVDRIRTDFVHALASPSILERFIAHQDRQAAPRHAIGGSRRLTDPRHQWIVLAAARMLSVSRHSKDRVRVDCGSTRIVLSAFAAPILHFIQDHDPIAVSAIEEEFADRVPADEIRRFLQDLAEKQVASFVFPED